MLAVLTAVPSQGNRHDQARQAIDSLDYRVCQKTIGHRAAFGDAGALGLSVLELDPKSRASEEVRQVYLEVLLLLGIEGISQSTKPDRSKRAKATAAT